MSDVNGTANCWICELESGSEGDSASSFELLALDGAKDLCSTIGGVFSLLNFFVHLGFFPELLPSAADGVPLLLALIPGLSA